MTGVILGIILMLAVGFIEFMTNADGGITGKQALKLAGSSFWR